MKKLLYIFMLTKDDIGPKEHVRNILKHTSYNVDVVTNLEDNIWNKLLKKLIKSKFENTIINIFIFQIIAIFFILRNIKNYDVILLRQSVGFFMIPVVAKILKIKLVIEVNGFQYQDLLDRGKKRLAKTNKLLEHFSFRYADKIVCVHDNIKQNLIMSFKVLHENIDKIVVVENGIEPTRYKSVEESKEKHNVSQKEFRIGYLGSYAHREGVEFLPKIAQKLKDDNIKFVLIGGTKSDVYNFQKDIDKQNMKEKFELSPYVPLDEALDILKTCDICIHLRRPISGDSNSQGSPLKMLDYHNIGRYVIASDIDSYKYIEENSFGLLVDLTKESFKDDIKNIINSLKNRNSIVSDGKRAYEFIQNKSWEKQIKKLDRVLGSL